MENWKKDLRQGGPASCWKSRNIDTWCYDLGVSNLKNNLKIGLKWGVWRGKDTLVCPSTTHQEKVMTGFLNWDRVRRFVWVVCALVHTPPLTSVNWWDLGPN